jgi:BASS family bile acid:Na+ symporter
MREILSHLLSCAVTGFGVASMASVGLGYSVRQIIDPLRNWLGVFFALVANFVVVPLLGYAIARTLSLDRPFEIGLLLVAFSAGAPFVVKLTQIAGGNLAFAAGLLVLLLVVTIGYIPMVVPLALPDATASASAIARPLLWTMLLPLAVGLWVRAQAPHWAERVQPIADRLASLALVVLVGLSLLINLQAILSVFGTGAILAGILLIVAAFVTGYLLGSFGPDTRDEVALGTAQRNFAAAMVVAQSLGDPQILVMVVVTSIVTMVLLFPTARVLHRYTGMATEQATRSPEVR